MRADRRQFLTAATLAAGGPLLGPIVAKIRAEAAGAAPPPRRFVFVLEGNGLPPGHVLPKGVARDKDRVTDAPLADLGLPPSLAPVAAFRDRLTVVQGLSGKMCPGGHSNDYGALGCYNAKGGVGSSGTPQGETIDYALGKKLSAVFPQVTLGIAQKADGVVYNCSAAGKGRPLPTQLSPRAAYQGLFGSALGGDARKAFDARKNLLDHMADDVRRAEAAVTGPDRETLRTYLGAFEGMRERHDKLVGLEAAIKKNAPPVTDKFTSPVETDALDAHFDLATAALVGRLTNVATIASGVGGPYFGITFKGLGVTVGKHTIGHGGGGDGKTSDQLATVIRAFHFDLIARMMKKLGAVKEGGGTMLDNTLVVYLSDAAEGHHSRCWQWPMVLLGGLGGKLRTGRYLEYPAHGAKGHRTIANLYCTLAHAAGHPRDTFGAPDGLLGKDVDQKGPLAELLA